MYAVLQVYLMGSKNSKVHYELLKNIENIKLSEIKCILLKIITLYHDYL